MNKTPLWRQTPPAIFPVALGFLGIANAWVDGASIARFTKTPGNLLVGMATAYFLFMATSYLLKFLSRPGVLIDDLSSAPGRAGMGANAMGFILLSLALWTFSIGIGLLWWFGIALYIVFGVLSAKAILNDPPEARIFSPFQYLTFVGLIVAVVAGAPRGYEWLDPLLAYFSLVVFIVITVGWGMKLRRVFPPVPQRATIAMVLAPISLFAIAFGSMEVDWLAHLFYWLANATFIGLLLLSRWMTKSGWTPVWGSFVFPAAAFANMQNMAVWESISPFGRSGIYVGLLITTPIVIYVLVQHSRAWLRGDLAKLTGAATA